MLKGGAEGAPDTPPYPQALSNGAVLKGHRTRLLRSYRPGAEGRCWRAVLNRGAEARRWNWKVVLKHALLKLVGEKASV